VWHGRGILMFGHVAPDFADGDIALVDRPVRDKVRRPSDVKGACKLLTVIGS